MNKIKTWLAEEESGQGMVEYALIAVLVSIACYLGLMALRAKIESRFFTLSQVVFR